MRQSGGSSDGVNQCLSVFIDTPPATVNTETKLFSAFKKDNHASKLYLAGRGESAHLRVQRSVLTSMFDINCSI